MEALSLFERPAERVRKGPPAVELRPYQTDAVTAVQLALVENRSTLLVMATGLGKTTVFGQLAKTWPGRVLVIAHRDELIQQAQKRLQAMTGEFVDVEQANLCAGKSRIVIGSVQTLMRESRIKRFKEDTFSLVIVDEAHHATSASYKKILEYFSGAKVLGVTATPDRGDRKALGTVFESHAYGYDIADAISDGWLVPLSVTSVHVGSIDLSSVGNVGGDLNQGHLDAVMRTEENIHGVVNPCLELAGDRRTIVFTTGVECAHRMAEIFNRHRQGAARAIDGGTDRDERRSLLRAFEQDEFQFLVNVGIATEGFDSPGVSCIAIARPTQSRALYTQMVGRGLRLRNGKTDCLVLDFKGNSGKHTLVSPVDVLGGEWTEEEVVLAKELADKTPGANPANLLNEAKAEILARLQAQEAAKRAAEKARASIRARVQFTSVKRDPFSLLGDRPAEDHRGQAGWKPATNNQIVQLKSLGIDVPRNCSKKNAAKLVDECARRRRNGLASVKQLSLLQTKQNIDFSQLKGLRLARATEWIGEIIAKNWAPLDAARVAHYLSEYTPGEEG